MLTPYVAAAALILSVATAVSSAAAPTSGNFASIDICSKLQGRSAGSLNDWEKYQLDVCNGPKLQPPCMPFLQQPTSGNPPKGIVALFHGYSACPNSYRGFASQLASLDLQVYVFLFPGHGRAYNDCIVAQECADGYPTESLPTSRQKYIDMVKRSVFVCKSEFARLKLTAGSPAIVGGISHGGAASTYAAAISNGFFTHKLLVNSFFGISHAGTDDLESNCEGFGTNSDQCILGVVNASLETFGFAGDAAATLRNQSNGLAQEFMKRAIASQVSRAQKWAQLWNVIRGVAASYVEGNNPFLDALPQVPKFMAGNISWGPGCYNDMAKGGRFGMCSFKVRNMFAAHSFAQYSLAQSRLISSNMKVQIITVERDGLTRNGLIWQAAQAEKRNGLDPKACMFRVMCKKNDDNTCGVPHSMLDPTDNMFTAPFNTYWLPYTTSNILKWISGTIPQIGVPAFTGSNIGECVIQSVDNPNRTVVGYVIPGGVLELKQNATAATGAQDTAIWNSLASQLMIPGWTLYFYRLEDTSQQGLNKFFVIIPDTSEPDFISKLQKGQINNLNGIPIVSYLQEKTGQRITPGAPVPHAELE